MKLHAAILHLGGLLGYSAYNLRGACFGFSIRWIEAALLKQQGKFNDRILNKILAALNDPMLLEKISIVKQKVRDTPKGTKVVLTNEEFSWLELLAFYDSLIGYHNSYKYRDLFGSLVLQGDIARTSQLVGSDEICAQGGLSNVYSVLGIYSKDEIKQHLNQLALAIRSAALIDTEPVGVELNGHQHAMGLCYYASINKWVLKDINQKATIVTDDLAFDDIVDKIFDGFRLANVMESGLSEEVDDVSENDHESEKQEIIEFDDDDAVKLGIIDTITETLYSLENDERSNLSISISPSKVIVEFCKTEQGIWKIEGGESIAIPSDTQNRKQYYQSLADQAYNLLFLSSPHVVLETNVILSAANVNNRLIACLKEQAPQQEITEETIKKEGIERLVLEAASGEHIDVLTRLIYLGAPMDSEETGSTPLAISCQNGHADVVSLLIAQGKVDVNREIHPDSGTPLFMASRNGQVNVVDVLVKCVNIQIDKPRTSDGYTPLIAAVADNYPDIVSCLLTAKADPNCAAKDDMTPLLVAVRNNYPNMVSLLLAAKANPNIAGKDGVTPLLHAVEKNRSDIVSQLLAAQADPNGVQEHGTTPLLIAACYGYVNIIDDLLKCENIEVNKARFTDGLTPLFVAVCNNRVDVISRLLAAHANPNVALKDGVTMLLQAVADNRADIIEMLLSKDLPLRTDVDQGRTSDHLTPLYYAAENGYIDTVRKLIEHGATVDKPKINGNTPLYIACMNGHANIVDLLIKNGADVVQSNASSPNIYAFNDNIDNASKITIIGMLIKAGVKPSMIKLGDILPIALQEALINNDQDLQDNVLKLADSISTLNDLDFSSNEDKSIKSQASMKMALQNIKDNMTSTDVVDLKHKLNTPK